MVKEKVKYIDGTVKEIEVKRLGFRSANQLAKKYIPINNLSFAEDGTVTIHGDIDMLGLAEECLKTIEGLDLDKLDSIDANRIYKTYFEKDVMSGFTSNNNPNLNGS